MRRALAFLLSFLAYSLYIAFPANALAVFFSRFSHADTTPIVVCSNGQVLGTCRRPWVRVFQAARPSRGFLVAAHRRHRARQPRPVRQ